MLYLSWDLWPECKQPDCLRVLRREKFSLKNRSDVSRQRRVTFCPYTILKLQLVEHNLVFSAHVLLFSHMETCKPAFSECYEWWSREYLNLQKLSSWTLLGSCRRRSWLFVPSSWKLGILRLVRFLTYPRLLTSSTHRTIVGHVEAIIWYGVRKFLLTVAMNCIWTHQASHWTVSEWYRQEHS